MNGRGIAAGKRSEERPSRQINVVLRSPEPIASVTVDETEAVASTKSQALPQYLSLYQEIQKELDHLVGLDNIKDLVFEVYAFLQIAHMRTDAGLLSNAHVYHMIFKGNPGTGKTTVARIIAKMLQKMGVLSKGHLIEVERADLVGEYIGHTAQKTRDLVKKSLGGVLFIDEAYSLARGGEKDFGKEAIDTLVKSMEDQKNQFILILAGYSGKWTFFYERILVFLLAFQSSWIFLIIL